MTKMLKGAVFAVLVLACVASPVEKDSAALSHKAEADVWTSIPIPAVTHQESLSSKQDLQGLVQLNSEAYVPDYPGCGLGHMWCAKFKEANISSSQAAMLSMANNGLYDEWYFNGVPTCVARGNEFDECTVKHVLFCAGDDTDTYGYAHEQALALKTAIDSPDYVHPECPGCARGRDVAHMTSICIVAKETKCEYQCELGYVQSGELYCNETTGVLAGGECIRATIDTELHEMFTPTPTMMPTPTIVPSPVIPTAADVAHENWTHYDAGIEERETEAYQTYLAQDLCNYMLELENDFQMRNVIPDLPIRSGIYIAGRAALCSWVHDAVTSKNEERKQRVPARGDHGPWPEARSPTTLHVRVEGVGVLAVQVPNLHATNASGPIPYGKALIQGVADRLGMSSDKFTIYLPNSIHPVEEMTDLSHEQLHYTDFLVAKMQHHASHDHANPITGEKLSWDKSHRVDADVGPIAP